MRHIYCAAWLLAATLAHATDGVIEINHAKIMAAGGYPYTISQSGSYRLTGNLVVADPATSVLVVTAADVSIDLNGHSIIGPLVCSGTPVTSCAPLGAGSAFGIQANAANVSVRNGTVRGMTAAGLSQIDRLENVTLTSNNWGLSNMTLWEGAIVSHCKAVGNLMDGFVTGGTLSHSIAAYNGGNGVSDMNTRSLTVIGSSFIRNGQRGVTIGGSITDSVVEDNGGIGIVAHGVVGNKVSSNAEGIWGQVVDGNAVTFNTGPGLRAGSGAATTMRGNYFSNNNGGGANVVANGGFIHNAGGNVCGAALCP